MFRLHTFGRDHKGVLINTPFNWCRKKEIVERRSVISVTITNIFSAIWTARTRGLGQSSTSSQPRSQTEVVSLATFHTWSIAAPCFERLWSCCRWFFRFFLRECGFYRFKTNRRSTTINKKHKYRKQSEIKSQNQEGSGSKTRGFALSLKLCEFVFKQLAVCCCFPCTVGWLVSLKILNV